MCKNIFTYKQDELDNLWIKEIKIFILFEMVLVFCYIRNAINIYYIYMCVFFHIEKSDLWKRSSNGGYCKYRVRTGQIQKRVGRGVFSENCIILTI